MTRRTLALLRRDSLVNALLRAAKVVIALSLTPTPSLILPFVVRDIVTGYWVKLDDL